MSDEPAKLPDPWERQPAESDEAWLAFRAYRDMAPDERMIRHSAIKGMSTLTKWYRDHNWRDRVVAFDKTFDKIRLEERAQQYRRKAQEIAIDHMLILADARELVTRELGKLVHASRENDMPGMVKVSDLTRLLETMVKMDRLVRGQTTANDGAGLDLTKLSVEELEKFEELMTKAQGDDAPDDPRH